MTNLRIQFDIGVPPGLLRWGLSALLLAAAPAHIASENVTLSTYYPSPSGVYTQMITTGRTLLARDGGNVGIGTPTPAVKLDVIGAARVTGDLSVIGSANITGTLTVDSLTANSIMANSLTANSISLGGVTKSQWPTPTTTQRWSPRVSAEGWATATISCSPAEVLVGCSGYYGGVCWGSARCDYIGSYPSGNTCVAVALDRGYGIWAIAVCLEVK